MRLTILLLMCCGLSVVLGALEANRTPQKHVEADCRLNTTENSIELNLFFALNGDPAEAFIAVNQGSTNAVSCNFGGSLADVITLQSKVYVDGSESENPCGVQRIFSEENSYQWYFEVREFYDSEATVGIITDMDARYSVVCSMNNALDPQVSPTTEIRVVETDDEVDATRVRPSSQMSALTRSQGQSDFVQENAAIRRGQEVKLRVQTKAKTEGFRNVALDHYGSYIHSCEYRTSLTGDRTMFILQNGCPNNQFPEMVGGFTYATNIPTTGSYEWYLSESSAFILARENTDVKRYYITCYLGYCYGPKFGDTKCDDYCDHNTKRKRRALSNEFDRISISVEVTDEPVTQTEERTGAESGTMVIAIVSSVTIIVFVAIVVLVILVCLRRRQQEREDWATSSTTGSNLNLPQHLNVQQVRHQRA